MGYKPHPDHPNPDNSNDIIEGDRICVFSLGGMKDTGIFKEINDNYLMWIRDTDTNQEITETSIIGINIVKLN